VYAAGDYRQANSLLDEAVLLARDVADEWASEERRRRLPRSDSTRGTTTPRYGSTRDSLAIQRRIADRHGEARSVLGIAQGAFMQGRLEDTEQLVQESLRLTSALGDRYQAMWCLETIAALAVARGAPERAALLLGAAERVRTDLGAGLAVQIRRDFNEPTLATVRADLGEQADGLIAEGRKLDLERTVDSALRALPATARSGR
jgi:hypothetical protein